LPDINSFQKAKRTKEILSLSSSENIVFSAETSALYSLEPVYLSIYGKNWIIK